MNRLLFGTLALGVMLCVLFVQSDATQLPVPKEQTSVPEPSAAGPTEPAPAAATGGEVETVTEYRTEYRDVRVCVPGGACRIVRQAVRVPVQVTRRVAKAAAAVVRATVCECGCGGTCGGTCGCADCTCQAPATREVVRYHSVRTSPSVVTYGSTGTSSGAYATYSRQVTYQPTYTRAAAWRPFARLRAFRGGCR